MFAETDIVNLVKSGIPRNEIMNSLADAIVSQNLAVLTRGNTLKRKVLLLGGPNTYLPFLQECWRLRIPEAWAERGYEYRQDGADRGADLRPEERASSTPRTARCCSASTSRPTSARYRGLDPLDEFINHGRKAQARRDGRPAASSRTTTQRDAFAEKYKMPRLRATPSSRPGKTYRGVIGLDGGSTSSKCVLIDEDENILKKVYTLSKGNPIQDMKDMFARDRGSGRPTRARRSRSSASASPATPATCSRSRSAPT